MSDLSENPFSGLFSSVKVAETFREEQQTVAAVENSKDLPTTCTLSTTNESTNFEDEIIPSNSTIKKEQENLSELAALKEKVNRHIENVFLITLDKSSTPNGRPQYCIYLEDLHLNDYDFFDLDIFKSAVFERLMLADPQNYLIKTSENATEPTCTKEQAVETRLLFYLYNCYCRNESGRKVIEKGEVDLISKSKSIISRNFQFVMTNSEFFPNQDSCRDIIDLITKFWDEPHLNDFINGGLTAIESTEKCENITVLDTFKPLFNYLLKRIESLSITDSSIISCLKVIQLLTTRASVALALIKYSSIKSGKHPKLYEKTLLGVLMSKSSIPKSFEKCEFFNDPASLTSMVQENTERSLCMYLANISKEVTQLLMSMLRIQNPEVKHSICTWIGSCLQENDGRSKLWHHLTGANNHDFISDGTILNLSSVLLQLCEPIITETEKLFRVDPTYCAVEISSEMDAHAKGIHMGGMAEEVCLIASNDTRPQTNSFKFITECFYMTHKSLQIGFHTVHSKMTKIITEIRRLQRLYTEAVQNGGDSSDLAENLKQNIEKGTAMYFCTKTHMMEPRNSELMLMFYTATLKWLVNLALNEDCSKYHPVNLSLPVKATQYLQCIPEFIIDNVIDYTTFLRRFSPRTFEVDYGQQFLTELLNLILVFMGSPERMKNPHLRAKLAEALENIMPHPDESNPHLGDTTSFAREQLFRTHAHSHLIVPELLHVFVSIEMTGQSVAFEQKFNYRRPMYEILEYLWDNQMHRNVFKKLAQESEISIKNPDAPLFLRFIHLLMNDANYLLDEGLMHVSKLRDHQHRRETEEYKQLSLHQRQEAETAYRHTGMLARFHNIMGRQTINTLKMLTTDIKSIFVHPINVERIANMLNYFLLHLVGPKRKQLVLQDKEEFDFKPQDLVSGICNIYVNLGESQPFLTAVASDGRSYSADLLERAEEVLCKIRENAILSDFREVATKVQTLAQKLKIQEESFDDVPEEFLDAILGSIMIDPVILPSSSVVVDRSTIARHLLSDQSDPFNRSPLTMDMVKPAEELKKRIENYIKNKKQDKSE